MLWKIVFMVVGIHLTWALLKTLVLREIRLQNEHKQMEQGHREYYDFSTEKVPFWKEYLYHLTFRSVRPLYDDAGEDLV